MRALVKIMYVGYQGEWGQEAPYPRFRYLFFTQAVRPGTGMSVRYGERFANYIKEHDLGFVTQTGENVNPNSGNNLTVWIWTVDHLKLKAHAMKNLKMSTKKYPTLLEKIVGDTQSKINGPETVSGSEIPRG